jgi:CelD/BcsL family acetyltransferase involved in cellulose biosynthesis/Tfp pilus assembly protein PilF/GNAT superfamily N-acetyltransferase
MFVEVLDTNDALGRVKRNWDAVYDADPEAQFFLSWIWIANWFEDIDSQWIVLAAKESADASEYVAFFPLQLGTEITRAGVLTNFLRTGGGYFAGYAGFICTPDLEDRAIAAFAAHLLARHWTSFRLENLCASEHRLKLFFDSFSETQFTIEKVPRPDDGDHIDHDIYLSVGLPGAWETYLETCLSANSRKKARRALRMMEQSAELRITHATPETFQRDLRILLRFWEAQWKDKLTARYGERVPRALANNFHNMLNRCFKEGAVLLPILWQGDKPIAAMGNLIDKKKGTLISLVGSRDMTAQDVKPGFLLDLHCMQWAIANDVATYDLLTGNYPYKYSFAPIERRIECWRIATRSGRNLGDRLDPETLFAAADRVRDLFEAGLLPAAESASRQILDADAEQQGLLALLDRYKSAGRPPLSHALSAACASHRLRTAAQDQRTNPLIDVIADSEGLARLKDNWNAVYAADPESQFYMSWTWLWNWLEKIDCQWIVLALKAEANAPDYVAFFALQLRTVAESGGTFHNDLRMAADPFAAYNNFICMPGCEEQAAAAFATHIRGMNWTNFVLDNAAISEGRLRPFLAQFPSAQFVAKTIPRPDEGDNVDYGIYPYIRLPADWDAYCATQLSAKARQKARQFLKLVDAPSEYRITLTDASTLERDLNILLKFWEIRWKPKYTEAAMRSMLGNNRKMLMRCFGAQSLFLAVFWKGDTPIAARAALLDRAKRSFMCLVIGRDLSFRHPSPGFMLNIYSLRWAIQNGFTKYDLQQGNAPYKYEFGPEERRINCLLVQTRNKRNRGERLDLRSLPIVVQRAQAFLSNGRHAEAEAACRQVLHADPDHIPARDLLARIAQAKSPQQSDDFNEGLEAHRRGALAEAERLYRLALAADPQHFDATHLLGVVFLQRNECEAAEQQIKRAIFLKPDFAAAHNNRGNALRACKRAQEALTSYDRAIELRPDYAEAHNNRGCALLDLNRRDDALPSFDKAIALKPDYAFAFGNRGNLLRDIGRFKDALSSYDTAIALKPDYSEAITNRDWVLKKLPRAYTQPMPDLAEGGFVLRDYGPRDRNACLALFDSNVPGFFAAAERGEFLAYLDKLPGQHFVLEQKGVVIASGGVARFASDPGAVVLCWGMVQQDRQKQGLGRVLLLQRLQRIAETATERMIVVHTSSATAGFYEKFGFQTYDSVADHFAPGLGLSRMRISTEAVRRFLKDGQGREENASASDGKQERRQCGGRS